MNKLLWGMVFVGLLGSAHAAMGECFISGTITPYATTSPDRPAWKYVMEVSWDSGFKYGLSHFNLLLDERGRTCVCQDFDDALSWEVPSGSSDGEVNCTVDYETFLECKGDPSIPGVDGYLLKFEPVEFSGCLPSRTGTATVIFYSDLPPAPIDEDILALSEKSGRTFCFGNLSGYFPALACDPVSVEGATWGTIKSHYR